MLMRLLEGRRWNEEEKMIVEDGWFYKQSYSARANQQSIQTSLILASKDWGLFQSLSVTHVCLTRARYMPIHVHCLKSGAIDDVERKTSPSIELDPRLTGYG